MNPVAVAVGSPAPPSAQRARRTWPSPYGAIGRAHQRRYPAPSMSEPAARNGDALAPSTPAFDKLSIFYPMWNEEEYIERALAAGRRASEHLLADGEIGDYELIVIDDASTDATGAIADRIDASDPRAALMAGGGGKTLTAEELAALPKTLEAEEAAAALERNEEGRRAEVARKRRRFE